jgi:DNA-binding transcriptional MerR regulator
MAKTAQTKKRRQVRGARAMQKVRLVPLVDETGKATDAFRTISEVSDTLNVPKHVLRFWEGRFSQLKPMKRGGGRRLYRPEDMDLLTGIRHLLHASGYTIRGVQQLLRKNGVEWVKKAGTGGVEIPVSPGDDPEERAERRKRIEALIREIEQCLETLGVPPKAKEAADTAELATAGRTRRRA